MRCDGRSEIKSISFPGREMTLRDDLWLAVVERWSSSTRRGALLVWRPPSGGPATPCRSGNILKIVERRSGDRYLIG
jgi:hypothetical protein